METRIKEVIKEAQIGIYHFIFIFCNLHELFFSEGNVAFALGDGCFLYMGHKINGTEQPKHKSNRGQKPLIVPQVIFYAFPVFVR